LHTLSHDFVNQQQLLGEHRLQVEQLLLHPEVVPDALDLRVQDVAGVQVDPHLGHLVIPQLLPFALAFADHLHQLLLHIKPAVLDQGLGHHQQLLLEDLHAETLFGLNAFLVLLEVVELSDLELALAGNQLLIFNGVLNLLHTILHLVLDLVDGVVVGASDENGATHGVFEALDEGEFVVFNLVLVNMILVTEVVLVQVVETVDLVTAALQR